MSAARISVIVSLCVALATTVASAQGIGRRVPAGLPRLGQGTWSEHQLTVDHTKRLFLVYKPQGFQPNAPAVLLLHGGTQSMRKIFGPNSGGTREWPLLADREGFLLIAPNATDLESGDPQGDSQNWNDLREDDPREKRSVDDVAFLKAVIEWTANTYRHDRHRVYVTGASNGGMMTYRLLIETPQLFAAGAAFIASLPQAETLLRQPALPTPLLICNATKDPLVPWEGGNVARNRGKVRSVEASLNWWITANRATTTPQNDQLPDRDPDDRARITRSTYAAQTGGAPVVFLRVEGGGHALPSASHQLPNHWIVRRLIGTVCRDAEGAELAWDFMKQFSRQPSQLAPKTAPAEGASSPTE